MMYHRQRLPIVVNMGSGLGQSLLEGYSRRLACLAGQRFLIVVNTRNGPFWRLIQDSVFPLVVNEGNGLNSHSLGLYILSKAHFD
jgi:hypothetical protein